jgi:ClpP class serine protease
MLDGLLQKIDLSKGLAIIINSPAGDGLAAERMINALRSYSKTGEFIVIVPSKAKSAATIVCFGASRIIMGPSSELGPVDPQLRILEDRQWKRFSLCNYIDSYDVSLLEPKKRRGICSHFCWRFTRLTNGFIEKRLNHAAAVCLHFARYNLVRVHNDVADDSGDGAWYRGPYLDSRRIAGANFKLGHSP